MNGPHLRYLQDWNDVAKRCAMVPESELEHCQDLVKDYEIATGNTEWKSRITTDVGVGNAGVNDGVNDVIDPSIMETYEQGLVTPLCRFTRLGNDARV